jgi:hypothetical protein
VVDIDERTMKKYKGSALAQGIEINLDGDKKLILYQSNE